MNTASARKNGFTLTELICSLVILSIIAAVAIPSFIGYIEKAKQEIYIQEARGVQRSLNLYLIDRMANETVDLMDLIDEVNNHDLTSKKNPLNAYLTVNCSPGSSIASFTLDYRTWTVVEMTYYIHDYTIFIDRERVILKKRSSTKKEPHSP